MKFTVTKGQDYREVLQRIEEFLQENVGDYTKLQSNMNIYLNLCDAHGDIYTKNTREYQVTKDEIYDKDDVAIHNFINQWKRDAIWQIETLINDIENLPKKVENIKKKLDKAVKSGFSTVDKWKQEFAEVEKRQNNASNDLELYNQVLYCIQHNIVFYEIKIERGSRNNVIYLRPIVDKESRYLSAPLYFYRNGCSFNDKQNYEIDWICNYDLE